jgi:thioredoxin 1
MYKKITIIAILAAAITGVLILKNRNNSTPVSENKTLAIASESGADSKKQLPKLLDLGAGKCIPCKMMTPVLDQLEKDFAGQLDVEFIDVWKDQSAGKKYGIRMIPTQILFDADGKELFRHEGFFSREDILKKWSEFGVELKKNLK